MNAATKFVIGAIAVLMLASLLNGPLGFGQAFLDHLRQTTASEVKRAGGAMVSVEFPERPLERVAVLSGPVTSAAEKARYIAAAKRVPGVHDVIWLQTDAAPGLSASAFAASTRADGAPTLVSAAAPTAAAPAAHCDVMSDGSVLKRSIVFARGRSRLGPKGRHLVAELARELSACPTLRLEIDGYTDSKGSILTNRRLSAARAHAVERALLRRGVASDQLMARGLGPLESPAGLAEDASARRVSFRLAQIAPNGGADGAARG